MLLQNGLILLSAEINECFDQVYDDVALSIIRSTLLGRMMVLM